MDEVHRKVMEEIWRMVPSCEPRYIEVSNLGRVRNGKTGHMFSEAPTAGSRIRKDGTRSLGYRVIPWLEGGKQTIRYVHRLVAEAWLGECPDGMQVNHVDGNSINNAVPNLEYCTPSQNIRHAYANGLKWGPLKTDERERAIELHRTGLYSLREIASMVGCCVPTIRDVLPHEGCANIKTTFAMRVAIHQLRECGWRIQDLADLFSVDKATVSRIVNGKLGIPPDVASYYLRCANG